MKYPTKEECERLLDKYGTPEHVKKHCRAVADTAGRIGGALKKAGYNLDTKLIVAAGMLHDIARVRDRHWEEGARIARELGYDDVGDIISVHMHYSPFSKIGNVTETDMVCLADRLVKEDKYVGIDERIEYIIDKASKNGHPEAKPFILEKKKDTQRFIGEIEEAVGSSIDELMRKDIK